jgi:hypothetical protein
MVSGSWALLVKFSECMVLWCKKLLPGSLGTEEVSLFFCGKFDAWEQIFEPPCCLNCNGLVGPGPRW